jgi:hypothetical protein
MLLWGDTFLSAISHGVERQPKILSILSALESHPRVIGGPAVVAFFVRTNAILVIVVEMCIVFVAWYLRLHWLEASVLGLLTVLLTYKVGNQNYFIPWLFLVAALPLAQTDSARRLAWFCVPFMLFLSVFQWGYEYNMVHNIIRNVGFVAFSFGVATIVAYFLMYRRSRSTLAPMTSASAGERKSPSARQFPSPRDVRGRVAQ